MQNGYVDRSSSITWNFWSAAATDCGLKRAHCCFNQRGIAKSRNHQHQKFRHWLIKHGPRTWQLLSHSIAASHGFVSFTKVWFQQNFVSWSFHTFINTWPWFYPIFESVPRQICCSLWFSLLLLSAEADQGSSFKVRPEIHWTHSWNVENTNKVCILFFVVS